MSGRYFSFVKSKWFLALSCVVLGAVIVLSIRFFTYASGDVHYHANFALYINGQRQEFKGAQYYTEVQMCTVGSTSNPIERAHMHDNVNNVVHVEDHAVTWGQFFANLGWYMGPTFIGAPDGTVYNENDTSKLNLLLNGQDYTDLGGLANTVIKDQDKLLVSFGDESQAVLKQQYAAIPSTAAHYDQTKDPKTCGSNNGSDLHQRLTHLF